MSVDYEGLTAEHRDLVAIQKRIGDALVDGKWHMAAAEIAALFRMSRPRPAPEPVKTEPRRTVGAVVRSVANGPLWAVIVAGAGSQKLRALSADSQLSPWGYTEASDKFVRWMTRAECVRHGIPYVERGATDTTSPAATEPAVAEPYRGADCLNMIGAVIDYYGRAFIVTSHGCSQHLEHPRSLACGHAKPSAITFLRWATREECERHGIPYVERGAAPSPAASPAAYVPKVGDVVRFDGDSPARSAEALRVVTKVDSDGLTFATPIRGQDFTASGAWYASKCEYVRLATAAERAAAGLPPVPPVRPMGGQGAEGEGRVGDQRVAAGLDAPAKPAPAVDREGFTTLLDAVKWVLDDATFKAPQQIGEVADRWVSRLERAIDSLPPSLTKVGAS